MTNAQAIARRLNPWAYLIRTASGWARRRQGVDGDHFELLSSRIYILPTGVGLVYAVAVFVMLLGAMNYSNSLAFVLTFALAAVGLIAMHQTHRNLAGTELSFRGAPSVHAGMNARFEITFANRSASARYDIRARAANDFADSVDVSPGTTARIELTRESQCRGWLSLERFAVESRFPFGLFRAWAWVYNDYRCLVWPAVAEDAPPLPLSASHTGRSLHSRQGDDDFAGLREYQQGDPRRQIAWKTLARSGELHSKLFAGSAMGPHWLDLAATGESDTEAALSVMARWIKDCETRKLSFGLQLDGLEIAVGQGQEHFRNCMDALALYGQPQESRT